MLIDLHAHVPHPDMLNQHPHWGPKYVRTAEGDMSLTIGKWQLHLGIPERLKALQAGKLGDMEETFARRRDPAVRINHMNSEGQDAQVLSLPLHNTMYWTETEFAVPYASHVNNVLAEYCSKYPDRLYFWAHTPLQDPAAAAKELRRAVTELGAVGMSMGGANFGGLEADDEAMDEVWRTLCDLDVPVFVHGYNQSVSWGDKADTERYDTTSIVGMMYDETRFFWHMVCGGVLDRFPNLKLYITHAGGFIPYHLGRFEVTNSVLRGVKNKLPVRDYLKNFWFDPLTHSRAMRRAIVEDMGADKIVYGSNFGGSDGIREDLTDGIGLSEADREKIRSGNALKLLRITPGRAEAYTPPASGVLQRAL